MTLHAQRNAEQPPVDVAAEPDRRSQAQTGSDRTIEEILLEMHSKFYNTSNPRSIIRKLKKTVDHVNLVRHATAHLPGTVTLCDIGGSFGDFASGCAAVGMNALFIDDFLCRCHGDESSPKYEVHKQYGAKLISRDVIAEGIDFPDDSIDIFTCFATMEHFHNSPKKLFAQVMLALKPGGVFLLSAPNAVDLMKRLTVVLGTADWSPMSAWYEEPLFRSHVREPRVADLKYIARDMRLVDVQIFGRNWTAHTIRNPLLRTLGLAMDRVLRFVPSLCGEIYLLGKKPSPPQS